MQCNHHNINEPCGSNEMSTQADEFKTCVSDKPIHANEDALGNNKYALGLLRFIVSSDTPVTIGIQGGWGSGKTSLINILKHHLESKGETLSVFVNAWEHSLFHNEVDKSSVAISLLSGLVESICDAIDSKTLTDSHDGSPRITTQLKSIALKEGSSLKRIRNVAIGLVALSARIGSKFVADVEVPGIGNDSTGANRPSGARLIRTLRDDLSHAVTTITKNSPYKRFVCFIDDLDRVHPQVAIEILDVLKNVFDVSECVFVLAIDFDVVVKGLKDKYGELNPENEREFRQYFDKIIQVPFAMPVGAYQVRMESFLLAQFESIRLSSTNISRLAEVARLATEGIPRGVKRIVNTMSLLMRIRESTDSSETSNGLPSVQLQILFTVVALQISFPEIYRRLIERPNFTKWTFAALSRRWQLNLDDLTGEEGNIQTDALAGSYGSDFDEEWEQVLYSLCQGSEWLRTRAANVSKILNLLLTMQEECESGLGMQYLQDALDAVHVTDVETKAPTQERGVGPRGDGITNFCHQVHENLAACLSTESIGVGKLDKKSMWAKQYGGGRARRYGPHELNAENITSWTLEWYDGLTLQLGLRPTRGRTRQFRDHVKKIISSLDPPFSEYGTDTIGVPLPSPASVEMLTVEFAAELADKIADLILKLRDALDTF